MNDLLPQLQSEILPLVLQVISAIVGLIVAWAAATAKQRWGIEIEGRHREALHSAIMSGVRGALLARLPRAAVISAALDYTRASVPDALKALQPNDAVLIGLAEAKLNEVLDQGAGGPVVGGGA
ncbi:hypothetical protein ACTTAI_13270 [Rhodobacter capsulatus]|uniref:hypothetical protein n=1 Tax=Rhodobacter capsulatus TaxID=1061 RepID=UPI004025B37F